MLSSTSSRRRSSWSTTTATSQPASTANTSRSASQFLSASWTSSVVAVVAGRPHLFLEHLPPAHAVLEAPQPLAQLLHLGTARTDALRQLRRACMTTTKPTRTVNHSAFIIIVIERLCCMACSHLPGPLPSSPDTPSPATDHQHPSCLSTPPSASDQCPLSAPPPHTPCPRALR